MALDVYATRRFRSPAWLPYIGPAVAVSIGYIDPGNWASDLAASSFGCSLLWVVLLANAVAIVVQVAVTRVTLAYGSDFGSLIARRWPGHRLLFWAMFQFAAIATDVAEFTGIVLGAQLMFGLSAVPSVAIGLAVVLALLAVATRKSMRTLDVLLGAALLGVTFVFLKLAFIGGAVPGDVLRGAFVPAIPTTASVFVIVAIIGATVMPHNLFLHSSLVAKRIAADAAPARRSLRALFAGETVIALSIATVVNVAIVIVGVALHGRGTTIVAAFGAMHVERGFDPSVLFGLGLLVSGVAATLTSTLAGDYICRSFGGMAIPTFARRAITILPAAYLLLRGTDATLLLLWSQVFLCLILPAALVPIILLLRSAAGARERGERRFLNLTVVAVAVCVAVDLVFLVTSVTSAT
jgi:manganese transport protein